jgi:hypothetical protein
VKGVVIVVVAAAIAIFLFFRIFGGLIPDISLSPKTPGSQAAAARAFGKDIQAGRYAQACSLLTPDSRAALDAADGCATSISAKVDASVAAALANDDYRCLDARGDVAEIYGRGKSGGGGNCRGDDAFLTLNRVDGKWLITLSP